MKAELISKAYEVAKERYDQGNSQQQSTSQPASSNSGSQPNQSSQSTSSQSNPQPVQPHSQNNQH